MATTWETQDNTRASAHDPGGQHPAQRLWGRTCTPVRLPWPLRCPGHAASCPLLHPHLAFSSPRGCMVCRAQPGLRGQQQLVGCSRPGGTGSCRQALSALPPPFQVRGGPGSTHASTSVLARMPGSLGTWGRAGDETERPEGPCGYRKRGGHDGWATTRGLNTQSYTSAGGRHVRKSDLSKAQAPQ